MIYIIYIYMYMCVRRQRIEVHERLSRTKTSFHTQTCISSVSSWPSRFAQGAQRGALPWRGNVVCKVYAFTAADAFDPFRNMARASAETWRYQRSVPYRFSHCTRGEAL